MHKARHIWMNSIACKVGWSLARCSSVSRVIRFFISYTCSPQLLFPYLHFFFINGICSHKLLFPYYGVFHMVLRELLPASNFSRTGLPYLFDYKAIAIIRWAWSFSYVYMTPWAIMGMQWIWTVKMRIQHRSRWEHATISDAPWS